ncbi:MAG: site-specific integrase [Candidatus Baltobacteraceae bacterium]
MDVAPHLSEFRVRLCRLNTGERLPLVIDGRGLPVPKPNLWALTVRRPRVQSNTLIADLGAIAHLYDWAKRRSIDLEGRFRTGDGIQPSELSALYQNLRYVRTTGRVLANRQLHDVTEVNVVRNSVHSARVAVVRDYLVWALEQTLYSLNANDPRHFAVRDRLSLIQRQARSFTGTTSQADAKRSGLSELLRTQLLSVIDPLSVGNPFHKGVRYRNWALIILMLTFGFRRGETLKVYVTDVNVRGRTPTIRIIRRPGDSRDPRAIEPAVKTLGREVPLQREMAALLNTYIQHHRPNFPSSDESPFLFLSEEGKPLSLRMVNYIFAQIVRRYPTFEGLLTPHVLRHTYNDMLSKAARENGLADAAFRAAQNYLNGWSLTSNQGTHYSQRDIEESAAQISLAHQRSLFS